MNLFTFIQEGANQYWISYFVWYCLCNILLYSVVTIIGEKPVGYCVIVDFYFGSETYSPVCQEWKITSTVVPVHTMMMCRRSRGRARLFLNMQPTKYEQSASCSGCSSSLERIPSTQWIGGSLDTGVSVDFWWRESLVLAGNWTLYCPASSLLLMKIHWLPVH